MAVCPVPPRGAYCSAVGFTVLAVVCFVGLLGPLLALPDGWRLPVVLGELLAGVVLGRTGLGVPGHRATGRSRSWPTSASPW